MNAKQFQSSVSLYLSLIISYAVLAIFLPDLLVPFIIIPILIVIGIVNGLFFGETVKYPLNKLIAGGSLLTLVGVTFIAFFGPDSSAFFQGDFVRKTFAQAILTILVTGGIVVMLIIILLFIYIPALTVEFVKKKMAPTVEAYSF